MAASSAEVRDVLADGDRPSDLGDLAPFIDAAEHCATQQLDATEFTTAALADIKKYLAAHFWAISRAMPKGGLEDTRIMDAQDRVSRGRIGGRGSDLQSTPYGRVALAISCGKLDNLGKLPARFMVM